MSKRRRRYRLSVAEKADQVIGIMVKVATLIEILRHLG
jgi:hypothetical protein